MKKAPKYGTMVQAKKDIVVGTTVIPKGTAGKAFYPDDCDVNVHWDFAYGVICWVNIGDIRKYDQN